MFCKEKSGRYGNGYGDPEEQEGAFVLFYFGLASFGAFGHYQAEFREEEADGSKDYDLNTHKPFASARSLMVDFIRFSSEEGKCNILILKTRSPE